MPRWPDMDESKRCTATSNRTRERCQLPRVPGTNVCATHGASAPQVKAAAERRVQEGKAMAAARRMMGDSADLSQYSDPVKALEFAIAYSHKLAHRLALVVDGIPDEDLAYRGRLGDQVRGELTACQRALSDLRGAAAEALKIGLAERQAGIRERTADMLQRALDTALQASGLSLEKQYETRDIFRRNMVIRAELDEPEEPKAITQDEFVDAEIRDLERRKEAGGWRA